MLVYGKRLVWMGSLKSDKKGDKVKNVYAKIDEKQGSVLSKSIKCSISYFTKSLWPSVDVGASEMGGQEFL